MKDRHVEYPNRFKLYKTDGSSEIVTIEALPGMVEEEGTALSKGTLLADSVCDNLALDRDLGTVSEALGFLANNMIIGKPKILTNGIVKNYSDNTQIFSGVVQFDDSTESSQNEDEYNGKETFGNDYKYSDIIFNHDNYMKEKAPKQVLFWIFGHYINSNAFAGTRIYLKCLNGNGDELYKIQIKTGGIAISNNKHTNSFAQISRAKLYQNCKFQIEVKRNEFDADGGISVYNFGILSLK